MTRADRGDTGGKSPLDALAHRWLRTVKTQSFIPGSRARARMLLRDLLEQLVAAGRAEPFEPAVGARVGADLVTARMAAPGVVSATQWHPDPEDEDEEPLPTALVAVARRR